MLDMEDKFVKDIVAGKFDDGKGKTIELDGFLSGIKCKKCNKDLPLIKLRELLDEDDQVHICPHKPKHQYKILSGKEKK